MARISEIEPLHKAFRSRLERVLRGLASEQIPLRVYESARSPFRQAELYARGRVPGYGTPGRTVTKACAFRSFHQYGLAVDMVFDLDPTNRDQWVWGIPKSQDPVLHDRIESWWKRYTEISGNEGLIQLSFEKPHIQLGDTKTELPKLLRGEYPPGGGSTWETWFNQQVQIWGPAARKEIGVSHPGAPPSVTERPAFDADSPVDPELVAMLESSNAADEQSA